MNVVVMCTLETKYCCIKCEVPVCNRNLSFSLIVPEEYVEYVGWRMGKWTSLWNKSALDRGKTKLERQCANERFGNRN